MCGIVGFANPVFDSSESPEVLKKMLSFIKHRGPDEMGYFFDDNVGIGSARLSIIDLTSGQQPINDITERYWICYNGELYNYIELKDELKEKGYVFSTTSDTEVLLYSWIEWGKEGLSKFNGAFAFVIYDRIEKSIVLARDRYGKRPLFYTIIGNTLVFGSELKTFLAFPGINFTFDQEELSSIFTLWTPIQFQTGFKNLKQLPSSSLLIYKNNLCTIEQYAPLTLNVPEFKGSFSEAVDITRGKLNTSVKLRLRSDVEVGTYLSGGLDSSIVTKLALNINNKKTKSFSITFDQKEFDEHDQQKIVSEYLGTDHTSLKVSSKDIVDNFEKAVWHSEVPVFRTAFVPMFLLSGLVKQANIKVVLTGEGADESFLGYDIFKETAFLANWNNYEGEKERKKVISMLYPYINHFSDDNINTLYSIYSQFLTEKHKGLFSHELRIHNSIFSQRILKTKYDPLPKISHILEESTYFLALNPVKKAQWIEFNTLLSGYLLSTQGDRMSLANNVENRCPFLDKDIVEWAASLPQHFLMGSDFSEKKILKEAFLTELPKEILDRPKQPYRAPDILAFKNHRQEWVDELLSKEFLKKIDFINFDFCEKFVAKIFGSPIEKISQRENQTFIFLLSLALLNKFFVERKYTEPDKIDSLLIKQIDKRLKSVI